MAKNRILSQRTADDIDRRVAKVLDGLGNPEPPLLLTDVRQLLRLDRQYYTASETSAVREKVSRIKVATVQVYERPTLLLDAIRKMSIKALYLPDQRRILLDQDEPKLKHRWNESHEVGHSLLPWHHEVMLGDNGFTLSYDCHDQIETEANYAAGQLLFLQERFAKEALDLDPTLDNVKALKTSFGNTYSTTLYRFVELRGRDVPIVGMISAHPHRSMRPADFDPARPCRHFIQSPAFAERFSRQSEVEVFQTIASYCGAQSGGPLGECELILTDDNGENHRFFFETFYNRYDALTLGSYLQPEPAKSYAAASIA